MAISLELKRPIEATIKDAIYRGIHPFTHDKGSDYTEKAKSQARHLKEHRRKIHTIFQELSK